MPSLVKISKVAVIGAGQMGAGIAQVVAQKAQLPVYLFDSEPGALKLAIASIESRLIMDVEKGKTSTHEYRLARSRIQHIDKLEQASDADIIIEAINEDLAIKTKLFKQLNSIVNKEAILASNTSSISITKLASVVENPERVYLYIYHCSV